MSRTHTALPAAFAGCLMLTCAVDASAATSPTFEITPFVGARAGGSFDLNDDTGGSGSVDVDSGSSFGIDLGLYRDQQGFYELLYSTQKASLDSNEPALDNVDIDIDYIQVGGTALFEQDKRYVPYLSLTVGAAVLKPDNGDYDSETKFAASLGGGFRFPFNDRISATAGVRGYVTFIDSDTDLFCASGPNGSSCLVKSSGSTFFQAEGYLGLTIAF